MASLGDRIQGWRKRKNWSEEDLARCLLDEGFQFDGTAYDLAKEIASLEVTDEWGIKDPDLRAFSVYCARCLSLDRIERTELELLVIQWLVADLGFGPDIPGWK